MLRIGKSILGGALPASPMLRDLCIWTVMAGLIATPRALAEEVAKAASPAAITRAASPGASGVRPAQDLYMLCAFYPKPGTCEAVYRKAMSDKSIFAGAVRAEYTGYARYLGGTETLTDTDRQYLKDNGILVPSDLSGANRAGLHNVITDTGLTAEARLAAVNNFLSRAVQAEIYCGLNSCGDSSGQGATTGT